MSDLTLKGLIGGHQSTKGYYDSVNRRIAAFISNLEAQIGAHPAIRIRMDLDGDGIYERVEKSQVLDIGNISRSIEYAVGKSTFGACSFGLFNNDGRFTDNNPKGWTYFDPANPFRYHYRKVIIDLGFDNLEMANDENWFPIYKGYIQSKTENGADRSVNFALIDEWTYIAELKTFTNYRADEVYPYIGGVEEGRNIRFSLQYGKATFIQKEYLNKNNQLMVPYAWNTFELTSSRLPYKYYAPQMLNNFASAYDAADASDLYFWSWRKVNTDPLKGLVWDIEPQWLRLPQTDNWQINPANGWINILDALNVTRDFYDVNDQTVQMKLSDYFTPEHKDYSPSLMLSIEAKVNRDNPAFILFDILHNILGIPTVDIDVTSDNVDNWQSIEVDYSDPAFYSFDVAYTYLRDAGCKVIVSSLKEGTFINVLDALCQLSRAGFFIDRGLEVDSLPTRRVHFVVHQPRYIPATLRQLSASRLRSPVIKRDMLDIYNIVRVFNYRYQLVDGFIDVDTHVTEDANSINVYGEKLLSLGGAPGSIVFLADSGIYAKFLGDHFLMIYKEPVTKLDLSTDLIGFTWDLKSLLAVIDPENLMIDYVPEINDTGIYEVYGLKFNTQRFEVGLSCQWAGYLFNPDGDKTKTWGFWDIFTWDTNGYYW